MQRFTVAMCVYHNDDAAHFRQAVESVTVRQTLPPTEVVIVVDGPITGELKSVVLEFEKQSDLFNVIWLPKNLGHAGARRTAFQTAKHEIIAIMDADDISLPDRFEKQLSFLESHPEVAVLGGQIDEFIDEETNIVGRRTVPCAHKDIFIWLKGRCPFNQMSVTLLRSPAAAVGGYLDWYCDEDYYLWIRMAEAGYKFANLPDVLVNVRVGKEMYARRGGWKYFKSEAKLQGYMFHHKLISFPRYVYNVLGRFTIQVAMPNRLRGFIFQKFFRE